MIVQCDQCSTKFRLDDSKVKDGGVKVRCSKCKHIFIVRKELPQEETEFDSVLSGLGFPGGEGGEKKAEPSTPAFAVGDIQPPPGAPPTPERHQEETVAGLRDERDYAEEGEKRGEAPPVLGEVPGFGEESPRVVPPSVSAPITDEPAGGAGEGEGFDFTSSAGEQTDAGIEISPPAPEKITADVHDKGGGPFIFDEEQEVQGKEFAPQAEMTQEEEETGGFSFPIGTAEPPLSTALQGETETGFPEDETSELAAFADDLPDTGEEEPAAIATGEVLPGEKPAMSAVGELCEPAEVPSPGEGDALISAEHPVKGEAGPVEMTHGPEPALEKEAGEGRGETLFAAAMQTATSASAPPEQEELPPLSIPSRRRGASFFPIVIMAISVLFIIALAGAGFYFLKEGPTGFNKVGLGFLASWFGMEAVEEGRITIQNPVGTFMKNDVAGEIFVISGEAINNFRKPRALIQVKATLFGLKGEPLLHKTIFCGNVLTKEQLVTLPMEKIEEAMNNQLGDSLANLGVQPAKGIPFVVVFANVPKDVGEFGVEVAGSSVASQ